MKAIWLFIGGLCLIVSGCDVHAKPRKKGGTPFVLSSPVAYVIDQDTNEVVYERNHNQVGSIASITKLMTVLVVVEMQQALDEILTITEEDIDPYKGTGSRLAIGTTLTRGEALELALMASENRAANVLGRSFPGGLAAFVEAMNSRARALGMVDTNYVEPTGLSYKNKSSAKDLAALVKAAYDVPIIREYSVATHKALTLQSGRVVHFGTTNRLVKSRDWEIGLQKTGFIREAGLCLVMQAHISGRKLIMVLMHSRSRITDAEMLKRIVMAKTG